MRRLLLRWLVQSVVLVFGISVLTFVLTSLVPGNPARSILGVDATPAQVSNLNRQLGLDRSLPDQYWRWLVGALHGDLGRSITSGVPVAQELGSRIGITLTLIIGATLVGTVVGIALGVASAVRGGWLGRVVDVTSLLGLAVPSFWLALLLVGVFAVELRFLPATGYVAFSASPVRWFESLLLPVVTLGLTSSAPIAKQTRDGVRSELGRDYVRVLRARGAREAAIVYRHVLRNAAGTIVTVVGLMVVTLLSATVLVETVFVLPGLGSLVVTATSAHDIPTVEGVAVVFTIVVVVVNLLVELLYAALNPKVRT